MWHPRGVGESGRRPVGSTGGPFQRGDRGTGASRRLIPEGAQRAAGVAHHGVGLAGDALGDAGKLSVDPLGLGDLVVVAAPQVALIDRARDRTVRVLSTSRVRVANPIALSCWALLTILATPVANSDEPDG